MPKIISSKNITAREFLLQYDEQVFRKAMKLREVLLENLPGIIEQTDIPARMIAYCHGQKYSEMICTLIPSKKGLKLGFNRGVDLDDPDRILEGTGKISRFVQIRDEHQIESKPVKKLLESTLKAYKAGRPENTMH